MMQTSPPRYTCEGLFTFKKPVWFLPLASSTCEAWSLSHWVLQQQHTHLLFHLCPKEYIQKKRHHQHQSVMHITIATLHTTTPYSMHYKSKSNKFPLYHCTFNVWQNKTPHFIPETADYPSNVNVSDYHHHHPLTSHNSQYKLLRVFFSNNSWPCLSTTIPKLLFPP